MCTVASAVASAAASAVASAVASAPGGQRLSLEVMLSTLPPRTLEEAERAHILATMKETKWVLSGPKGAATRLGMNRSTLQFRMKKLGILRPAM